MYSKIEHQKFKQDFLISIVLILLALATRIYGIAEWHFVGDENPTVEYASDRVYSLINPAYYVLILGSFELFGVTEWSARLPALILGVASVPVVYLTWRNIIGQNAALIGALLTIFSSWHLYYSQYSRFYTGVFLFGSLAYFFYYKAIQSNSLKYLFWAIAANLAAILFHLTSVLIASSFAVFSMLVLLSKTVADSGYSRRIAVTFLGMTAIGALFVMPFLWERLIAFGQWQFGVYSSIGLILQWTKHIQLPITISSLIGLFFLIKKDFTKGIFFALGIGIPALILMFSSMVSTIYPRYMFYALPLIFLLSAILCDQIRQSLLVTNYSKIFAQAVTVIIIFCMLPQTVSHYVGRDSLDFREAIAFIEKNFQTGDRILSYVQGRDHGFNRYTTKRQYVLEDRYGAHPNFNTVDWNKTLKRYEDNPHRMWIILQVYRRPLVREFEAWLMAHASLVWRKFQTRYDESFTGYEIWLMNSDLTKNSTSSEM